MFAQKSKRVVHEYTQARTCHLVKLIILYSTRSERIEALAESLKTIRHVGFFFKIERDYVDEEKDR